MSTNKKKGAISWEGIIEIGHKVDFTRQNGNNDWKTNSGLNYLNGYKCLRNIKKDDDNTYKITCSISSSVLQQPIFHCKAEFNSTQENFSARNPTSVMKKALNFVGFNPNRNWNGNEFFGLHRKDVHALIKTAVSKPLPSKQVERDSFLTRKNNSPCWVGVTALGDVTKMVDVEISSKILRIPMGYEASRNLQQGNRLICVHCKIEEQVENNLVCYTCYTKEDPKVSYSSPNINKAVSNCLKELNITSTRRWSGFDFFGLTRSDVMTFIENELKKVNTAAESEKRKCTERPSIITDVLNIKHRNAGPTRNLCVKSQKQRNELIHELVKYASSGDAKAYIMHLCNNYIDIIDDALESSRSYLTHFIETRKVSTHPIQMSCSDSAELLLGRCDLSQRGYNNLKSILKKNNVFIPGYNILQEYCSNLNVGKLNNIHTDFTCNCMGVSTDTKETLQLIVSNNKLFQQFQFLCEEKQNRCFDFLKSKDPDLYKNLNSSFRTIFIRSTGDNFRASAKMPTEQTSFSILNMVELSNNPYGQFISTLWRGSESREMIELHVAELYNELTDFVMNGVDLLVQEIDEHFNVIVFFVADLCFVKDVIGQCSCMSMYGCYHCCMKNSEWNSKERKSAKQKMMVDCNKNGLKAVEILGKNPERTSAKFTNFQQSHGGQWTSNLFPAFITELMPPCGLHLILANHRYMWKFLFDVLSKRKMEILIPQGLRKIGCGYLAYQIEQYHKSKKKQYDGSESLKMIGNDCKMIEQNINAFLDTFIRADQGETWESASAIKLKQILVLYNSFADLARDIRSVTMDAERIESFNGRAENYFKKFMTNASSSSLNKLPYLHYLRNHIGNLMMLHSNLFGWGYGVFCCHAGEHLNKLIKTSELTNTNLDANRFLKITHLMRIKQLIFTEVIMQKKVTVKCSACGEIGHNRKNKGCVLHPSHPVIEFDDSDSEASD